MGFYIQMGKKIKCTLISRKKVSREWWFFYLKISGVAFIENESYLALEYNLYTDPGAVLPALPFLWVAEFCEIHWDLNAVVPASESKDFSLTLPEN